MGRRGATRSATVAVLAAALLAVAGGCGIIGSPTAARSAAGGSPAPGGEGGAPAGEGGSPAPGGEGGAPAGEGAAAAFVHPTLHYSIAAPGPMKIAADGTASYDGTDEHLRIAVLPAGQPTALANAARSGAGIAGFRLLVAPHPVTASGQAGAVLEFTERGPTNPVTGRVETLHAWRAYVPKVGGGVFQIDYAALASQWDPQGAYDVLRSFREA